ncbi:lycopene cyclase domain-containing protein [Nocardioides sp. zg-DK7169]|uniref:lycopene cyclase domain-containing protein n=1 Tax=Nocardioides sp. zg-DK7169 TaxID=2736600 RepID=UPI001553A866|nr:lycopene cyclase domain-containing protein [Nocardioides sp. zg-DK7169]NPC97918.1 lycopene cyclase domain-containing protein [Nocardioides sp. zg-DK7169]
MTYVLVSSAFVAVALAVLATAVVRRRPDRRWWAATGLTLLALMALTAVFDNLMIAVDLFGYVDDQISGLKIGLAPIEDFAWPLAAVAGLPALALLLDRVLDRRER